MSDVVIYDLRLFALTQADFRLALLQRTRRVKYYILINIIHTFEGKIGQLTRPSDGTHAKY